MTVKDYSTTASSNTAINGININTGMPPSNVDNALRQYGKDIRDVWNDKEWFILGDGDGSTTFNRASATSVTVASNITVTHHVGRRIKLYGANTGTIYGKIATSSYSSPNTTLAFTFDSGSIHASDSTPDVYVGSVYNNPANPVVDEDNMASNSAILSPSQQSVKAYSDSGTQTLTNKSIALGSNTVTGTTAQFNTALSDGSFATLAGSETLTNKTLTSPVLNTGISGTAFKDEDNMSSDSATAVASQQSIKAYVDSTVTAQDLDITTDSGNIDIDLDSESLTLTGGTGINTSATGSTVTLAIDGTVVTESSTDTLTNKTLTNPTINTGTFANSTINSPTLTTPDLNGSELILDADQDTSITADTDDQVDIKIGGSDKISATSSQLTIGDNSTDYTTRMRGALVIDPVTSSGVVEGLALGQGDALTFGGVGTKIYKDRTSGVIHFIGNDTITIKSDAINIGNESITSDRATIQSSFGGNTGDVTLNHANVTTGTSTRFTTHSTGLNLHGAIQFKDTSNNNTASIDASGNITATNLGTISSQASNNVSITGGAISGLSLPTADTEASSKLYVDNAIAGMRTRIITKVATTSNVNLTNGLENGDSIDGITLQTGDKILVKSNTDATENGIYICPNSGTASRDTNYNTVEELAGQMIVVQQGSTNADKIFLCTTDNSGSIGSVNIVFSQVTPANQGTVQSVGLTQSGSEFTIGNTPITSSGNITLNVNRISATKIGANTNISDTEYGYLNGVTSNIQTQLDASASLGDAISFSIALGS